MRTENYSWQYWTGMHYNGVDHVAVYVTDPEHVPPQWQEELTSGPRKEAAIEIIMQDRRDAYAGVGYYEKIINAELRVSIRTNKLTGNSWEEKITETGEIVPIPGYDDNPPAFQKDLANAKVTVRMIGTRMVMTVTGTV